jgi:hypothetical protein
MPSKPVVASFLGRYALFVATLAVSLVVFPLLALLPVVVPIGVPARLGDALFFWPQYLLLPFGLLQTAPSGAVVGAGTAPFAAAAFWLIVIAALARLTLSWRKRWALLALFLGVALLAEMLLFVLGSLGFSPVLDSL